MRRFLGPYTLRDAPADCIIVGQEIVEDSDHWLADVALFA